MALSQEERRWHEPQRRPARLPLVDGRPWIELWVETVRLPDGRLVDGYYQVRQPDFVDILAVNEQGLILTLWQYRHGIRRVHLGLPAGMIDEGETPEEAARRELLEETGYEAREWERLGAFAADGNRSAAQGYLYLARGLRWVRPPAPGGLEDVEAELMTPAALWEHLRAGDVGTMSAAATIALGLIALDRPHTALDGSG
jgi:ADP-ribose pyrophosphatase